MNIKEEQNVQKNVPVELNAVKFKWVLKEATSTIKQNMQLIKQYKLCSNCLICKTNLK